MICLLFLVIIYYFLENPTHSIPTAVKTLDIKYWKIQNTLKKYKFRPFKFTKVQFLSEDNKQERLQFCQIMLRELERNPNFFYKIAWTDESNLSTSGIFNRKNCHYWSQTNPHQTKIIKSSGRRSINVWCGITNNIILGPLLYEGSLTGERYLQFLNNEIEEYLEEIPLVHVNRLIWQHDGAPPHNVQNVTNYLNRKYPRWIGRYGNIKWPPNSPDLTLMDRFFWGTIKGSLFDNNPTFPNIEVLQNALIISINAIKNDPLMVSDAVKNLEKCYRLCVQENGGHFEHLLTN